MVSFIEKIFSEVSHISKIDLENITCENTELLIINTMHIYGEFKRCLEKYSCLVSRYILLTNTTLDALDGEVSRLKMDPLEYSDKSGIPVEEVIKGVEYAFIEFIEKNPEWNIKYRTEEDKGMVVLERKPRRKKVVDGFIFYNELDMLDFRLKELNPFVDYFVLVESTLTFAGNPNELLYKKNKERYSQYSHKIIHVVVDDMPENSDTWSKEHHQRNCIMRGVHSLNLHDTDLVIISDVDEIPDFTYFGNDYPKPTRLGMDLYYYNLECKMHEPWISTFMCNYSFFKENSKISSLRFDCNSYKDKISRAGWHFSYFFDISMIINKIQNYSHQEYNNEYYTNIDYIKEKIRNKKHLVHGQGYNLPLHENKYLPRNYKMLMLNSASTPK